MVLIPTGLTPWTLDLFVLVNLVAVGTTYLWAAGRVTRMARAVDRVQPGRRRWPLGRTLAFLTGSCLVAITATGPLDAWAHQLFWPHMLGHLIIMMVAAPLIVLGSPVRLTFHNLPPHGRRVLVRVLRSPTMLLVTRPWFGWLLFAGVLIGSHLPPVMSWVLTDHDAMSMIERPVYLIAALIFYYPLIGDDLIARRPAASVRLVSLGLMMIPETVLGMVIHLSPVVLYRPYADAAASLGVSALTDQHFAGALMWALAMVLDGLWMMLAAVEWWREQVRLTARLERAEQRTVSA